MHGAGCEFGAADLPYLYMHIYIDVYKYVCMYVCMYAYMFICVWVVYVCVFFMFAMCAELAVSSATRISHTYICIYAYMYICMYVCTYVCMYICVWVLNLCVLFMHAMGAGLAVSLMPRTTHTNVCIHVYIHT